MFGLMPNGSLRQANLKMLFERAKEYEKASFKGLFNFINYINQLKMTSNDMDSAKIIGENEDVVRIMSIHKSKGLEFPVVILSSTAKKFNMQDLNETILLHQELGLGPKYIDEKRKIEYPTLTKTAIGIKTIKETLSEEMRILYVALTRAKEKLIITGVSKDFEKDILKKKEILDIIRTEKINPNILKQYKAYLDWILLVYLKEDKKAKSIINLNIYDKKQLQEKIKGKQITEDMQHFIDESEKYELNELLKKQLEWKYPYKASTIIPTMTSVSKIKELQMQKDAPDLLTIENKESKINTKEKEVPEFLKEEIKISKARIGSLIHLVLQKLNEKEEYNIEKIKNLINTLVQKQLITKKEAEVININDILLYTKSELFKDLKSSKEIHKETPFYFDINASEIVKQEVDEKILVQGIIDLYYIDKNDNLILVDYKTDFVKKEEELIIKYKKQLEIYKRALEESTSKKVEKVYIYSIYLQKIIEVNI